MGNIELFEQMADRYDTPERIQVAGAIAGAIRSHLGDAFRGKSALDYGCGTGLVGFALADLFDSMVFADAAPRMVEQVRRKIREAGLANARALCFDLAAGDAPAGQFDCIFLVQVLLHIREVLPLLARLGGSALQGRLPADCRLSPGCRPFHRQGAQRL